MIAYRAPAFRNKANEILTHEQKWKEDFIRELQTILMPQMIEMATAQFDKCGQSSFTAKQIAAVMAREIRLQDPEFDYGDGEPDDY